MGLAAEWRRAVRLFQHRPLLMAVATGSLVLGVAVGTAVFSVADAAFLRPLAVAAPERLIAVSTYSETGLRQPLSYPEVQDVASQVPSILAVAAYDRRGTGLRRGDDVEHLILEAVSDRYFETLGVRPALGRLIGPHVDDGLPAPAVVISDRLWRSGFGADASIVGRPIQLHDRPFTLVGVLPHSFHGIDRSVVTDVWISLATWANGSYGTVAGLNSRGNRHFEVLARLRDGADAAQAGREAELLGERWARAFPDAGRGRTLRAEKAKAVSGDANPVVLLLVAAAFLVLLIAAANAAALLVALGDERRAEIGIRQTLGASRSRIARQVLAEAALVVLVGLGGGLGLAAVLQRGMLSLVPATPFPTDFGLGLDGRVLAFGGLLALVAVLIGGGVPALRATTLVLRPGARVTAEAARPRHLLSLPIALVVAQLSLAVVALYSSALLMASFEAARSAPRGFDTRRNSLALAMSMGGGSGGRERWPVQLETVRQRALGLPGVGNATFVRRIPMAEYGGGATIRVAFPWRDEGRPRQLRYNQTGPAFVETLGLRVLAGRFFSADEHSSRSRAIVVSDAFAREYFPGQPVVGRSVAVEGEPHEIVGLVADVPVVGLHEPPQPFLYLPYARQPSTDVALVVESQADAAALAPALRRLVRETCPGAEVFATTTLRRHMDQALYEDWIPAVLGTSVAVLGMLLAVAGLYAATSRLAARRTREIGVRLALGAGPREVMRLVLVQGCLIAGIGAAVGLVGAFAVAGSLRSVLRGVSGLDARALLGSAVAAVALGLLASAEPAWRASRTDPAKVLRSE